MTGVPEDDASPSATLIERLARIRSSAQLQRLQRPLLAIAAIAFVMMTVLGLRHLPDAPEPVRWWLLLILIVTTPIGLACNAGEYWISARLVDHHASLLRSMRIAVLGSAFNLLPLPGSVLVRTQALREGGSSYKRAAGTSGVVGVGYISMGFAGAAVPLFATRPAIAIVFVGLAVVFGVATYVGVRTYVHERVTWFVLVVFGVEMGSVVIKSVAFLVIGRAVGYDVGLGQSLVLNLSTVITSAIGIFPGGLGIREFLAGVLSPLVGIERSVGLVITAFNRLLGLLVLALLAGVLLLLREDRELIAEAEELAEEEAAFDQASRLN
jgi:uncharacterized membrane protein YbhN (UPF0104 family)